MTESGKATFQVTCPCCKSMLEIDPVAAVVTECVEAKDPRRTADLKDAGPRCVLQLPTTRTDARRGYQLCSRGQHGRGKCRFAPRARA